MEGHPTSSSVIMHLQDNAILQEFLDLNRHRQTLQYSRRNVNLYQQLSQQFQNYHRLILESPAKIKALLEVNNNQRSKNLTKFIGFLRQFFQILALISDFQIQSLSKIRTSRQDDNIDSTFDRFRLKVQRYSCQQSELKKSKENYKNICEQIESLWSNFQNQLKKVENNFNPRFLKPEVDLLHEKLSLKSKTQQQISKTAEIISDNSTQFQKQLMFYRQKLITHKYDNIDRINRLCKNSKQSLMEIITYLFEFINQNTQLFAFDKMETTKIRQRKYSQHVNLAEYITEKVNLYNQTIDQYMVLIKEFILCFTGISKELRDRKVNHLEVIESFNKFDQYNECDTNEILTSLDSYTIFLKYISEIGDKLIYSDNNLMQLQKNVNKHKEIILSILKCKSPTKINRSTFDDEIFKKHKDQPQSHQNVEYLFQQMNQVYIQKILLKIYNDFRETIMKLRDYFIVNQPTRRSSNTKDSMSISYIDDKYQTLERRPSKKEVWMWKEWNKTIDRQFVSTVEIQKQVNSFQKYIEKYNPDQKQLQILNCSLVKKKMNGVLKLKVGGLDFESNNNILCLFIPFISIQKVDMQLNMMSKAFHIETTKGNLQFENDSANSIKKFYVSVQKTIDFFNENNQQSQIKTEFIIDQQQLEFIKNRKISIQKDLQNLGQYDHYNTIIIRDVQINDVYRVLYSDQPISIRGKQYECFPDYMMKKYNNINQKFNMFSTQGPQFYTGAKGVTFKNCPLYSQRVIQYDHILPKVPLLPSSCHNAQTVRVYWVSNQQLHIKQVNLTSGAPYTENFILNLLTTIHKIEADIQVRFFMKMVVVKDFALKKMVFSKAVDEAKWGNNILCQEMKRIMLSYKKKGNRQSNAPQKLQQTNLSQKTVVKDYKATIKNLESKNKMLIYVLLAVFILNILLNFII